MSGKAKIVVVDDDATMREALRETLAGEGYAVLAVDNAIQAIILAVEQIGIGAAQSISHA